MLKFFKKQNRKIGQAPGALTFVGEKKSDTIKVTLNDYSGTHHEVKNIEKIEDVYPYIDKDSVTWVNIDGLHDTKLVGEICDKFNIHILVREDILNTGQRPKIETFDDYIFLVLKMIYYDDNNILSREQISIVLGRNFVLTFQEIQGDIFDPLRKRIESGQIRKKRNTCDYLVFAIMDMVVDNYFLVLENINNRLVELDNDVSESPSENIVLEVKAIKRELLLLKKLIWPLKDLVENTINDESDLIIESTIPFLRDLRDHTLQVIETIELFREISISIVEQFNSYQNNKMNEVMKTLTIVASMFIPLTFIAGIYGMNFSNMPELQLPWAYPTVLATMVILAVGMVVFFKRKDWL